MNKAQAIRIAGSLSEPSKMPCKSYGLPAAVCITGGKLKVIAGSTCSICYAEKGCYVFPSVERAQAKRLKAVQKDINEWEKAMAFLIEHAAKRNKLFRWHDSGDLQSLEHLHAIVGIARQLPQVMFWLPTRERQMVQEFLKVNKEFPPNLIVRVSAAFVNQMPAKVEGCLGSTVHDRPPPPEVYICPAYTQGGKCRDCRACWDRNVPVVSYPKH